MNGIEFVGGRQLPTWLRGRDGDVFAKDAASDVRQRHRNYRAARTWQDA